MGIADHAERLGEDVRRHYGMPGPYPASKGSA
jgi:hypothetical protein